MCVWYMRVCGDSGVLGWTAGEEGNVMEGCVHLLEHALQHLLHRLGRTTARQSRGRRGRRAGGRPFCPGWGRDGFEIVVVVLIAGLGLMMRRRKRINSARAMHGETGRFFRKQIITASKLVHHSFEFIQGLTEPPA